MFPGRIPAVDILASAFTFAASAQFGLRTPEMIPLHIRCLENSGVRPYSLVQALEVCETKRVQYDL